MIPSILKHDQDSSIPARPAKIPKNDIKRFLPGMFVNAINSGDFQHIQNVLFSFLANECIFTSNICFPSRFHAPASMNSTGAQSFIHYLLGWHVMFPDTMLTLKESKLVSHSSFPGTIVEMDIEYHLTKAAHIPQELWIPPLCSTAHLYKAHSLQDMLYAVHLHTPAFDNSNKDKAGLEFTSRLSFQDTADKGVPNLGSCSQSAAITVRGAIIPGQGKQHTYSTDSQHSSFSSKDSTATNTEHSSTVYSAGVEEDTGCKSNESVALLLEAHATICSGFAATSEAQMLTSLQWPPVQSTAAIVSKNPATEDAYFGALLSAESAVAAVAGLLTPIGPRVVPPVPTYLPAPVFNKPLQPPLPCAQLPAQARIPDRFVDDLHAAAVLLHSPLPLRLVGQYVLYLNESNHIVHIALSAAPV